MAWLRRQTDLGLRAPGLPGHEAVVSLFCEALSDLGLQAVRQCFTVPLSRVPSGEVLLTNVLARIRGQGKGPVTLVCSHYDSRWIADNDPDPEARDQPILGANDGGSGTAVMLELARVLVETPPRGDVILGFMDGEDLGGLDGHRFAVGSRYLATHPGAFAPDEVIALDMVGGKDLHLDIELNSLACHPRAKALFVSLWRRGRALGLAPFFDGKERMVYSDHGPFIEAGLPAVLLIDLGYPEWHTHADRPEACEMASLEAVGQVLVAHFLG